MNVKELKERIENLPDEMEVILQKDAEGNGYSPLYCADPDAVYQKENEYSGNVYSLNWTAEDAGMDEEEWDSFKNEHQQVLVLAPTN